MRHAGDRSSKLRRPRSPPAGATTSIGTPYAEYHERANLARIELERACELASRGQLDGLKVIDFAGRYRMTLMLVERLYEEHFRLKRDREARLLL